MTRVVQAVALGAVLGVAVSPAIHAQSGAIALMGSASQPRSTVLVGEAPERTEGLMVGGVFVLDLGAVTATGRFLTGPLTADATFPTFDRDAKEIAGVLTVNPVRWFGVEGGYTYRSFDSSVGRQVWSVPAAGAVVTARLGHPALRTHLRGAYLPGITVEGLTTAPDFGIAVEAGLSLAPHGYPFAVTVAYRLERFEFPAGTETRLEQYDQVMLSAGFRIGGPQR